MIDLHTFFAGWIAGLATGVGLTSRRSSTHQRERQPTFAELLMPLPRDRDPDWRRSFNHENTNRPSGPPPLRFRRSGELVRMDEGRVQRGNGNGAPATPKPDIIPKPQFPSPQKIREDFLP